MNDALRHFMQGLQASGDWLSAGAEASRRRWRAAVQAISRLSAGTERWQAAVREKQVNVDLAEILRARTLP